MNIALVKHLKYGGYVLGSRRAVCRYQSGFFLPPNSNTPCAHHGSHAFGRYLLSGKSDPQVFRMRSQNRALTGVHDGDLVEVTCVDVSAEGKGVCRVDEGGLVVFVRNALPGERLTAKIVSTKKSYAIAEKIVTKVPHRGLVEAECPHFGGGCGGCTFQDLDYSNQLGLKEHKVRTEYRKLRKYQEMDQIFNHSFTIVGSPAKYRYRNKTEFSCAPDGTLGMHKIGMYDSLVPLASCLLQSEEADSIFNTLKTVYSRSPGLHAVLQHVVIRWSTRHGQALVNLVTPPLASQHALKQLSEELVNQHPDIIRGVVNSVSDDTRPLEERRFKDEIVLYGHGNLIETLTFYDSYSHPSPGLVDYAFRISPNAFFQINTQQSEAMYNYIIQAAKLTEKDVAFDLYCGSGSISIFLSQHCAHVYGVEYNKSSIKDAKLNAKLNKIANTSFYQGDVRNFPKILHGIFPDVVVVDPARGGMSKSAVNSLIGAAPKRIVYVSCNVATQVRDISQILSTEEYTIASVCLFDMFPHTIHVETVTVLERSNVTM